MKPTSASLWATTAACFLLGTTGCSLIKSPSMAALTQDPLVAAEPMTGYAGPDGADVVPASPQSEMEMVYHGTRQARKSGGIVLHIRGSDPPVRVLPLPPDGRSVYVSQLLTQSGIIEKLGKVDATLFRHSEQSISGIPMECKMTGDGTEVKPESDYALQPGDRLRVSKSNKVGLENLIDIVLQR